MTIEPHSLNDLYHARKMVQYHDDTVRFCKKLGGFLVWDRTRWALDETGIVWQWAIQTPSTVLNEENGQPDEGNKPLRKWALKAQRRNNIENALKHLQAQPEIVATPDMFDRDPWLFNVNNGTIDLQSGTHREHRPEDLITRISPVDFDPDAAPPTRWLQFLDEIFDNNKNLIHFVQRACGYALTGAASEQKLFFLHGQASTGKTTFLATLMYVMGNYAVKLPPGMLFSAHRNAHPAGYARLKGSRLAVRPETEFGRRLSEIAVKELTCVDPLTACPAHRDSFEFNPTHKLFLCGDHLPIIRGNEHASWQRIVLIPFSVSITREQQDKDLRDRLRAEAPGILNWLIKGCLEWQKIGLTEQPAEIAEAADSYRSDMDVLGDFLDDCSDPDPDGEVTHPEMRKAYEKWCERNGEQPMTAKAFTLRLKERGLVQKRIGKAKTRTWLAISLIPYEEPMSEEVSRRLDKFIYEESMREKEENINET